jgi:hypothetical protein
MIDANSRTAVTDSIGRFRIDSIPPGRYRVGIYHAIVDSLGISLVTAPVEFDAGKPLLVSLAIPSGTTIRQTVCTPPSDAAAGATADIGPAVLVGRVLDPENETALPNATVTLEWTTTAVAAAPTAVVREQRDATTDEDGHFCFCGLPSGLTGTLRAAFQSAPELAVQRTMSLGNRIVTLTAVHLPRISPGTPVAQRQRATLVGTIQRPDGSPLPHATVMLEGTSQTATTGRDGSFSMRGLPPGTQTLSVRSVGFEAVEQVVELTNRAVGRVTVTLSTVARVLSPIVVSAQRLEAGYARVGFDRRRRAGLGQFLTADDIAKRHATYFAELLSQAPALEGAVTPGGDALGSDRGAGPCRIYVLDGHPLVESADGEVDALFRAGQIVGIEIYSGATVPSEFRVPGLTSERPHGLDARGSGACSTIVLWTKAHLIVAPLP